MRTYAATKIKAALKKGLHRVGPASSFVFVLMVLSSSQAMAAPFAGTNRGEDPDTTWSADVDWANGSVYVHWTAGTPVGGIALAANPYQLYRYAGATALASGCTNDTTGGAGTAVGSATNLLYAQATGLVNGTKYFFKIKVTDVNGQTAMTGCSSDGVTSDTAAPTSAGLLGEDLDSTWSGDIDGTPTQSFYLHWTAGSDTGGSGLPLAAYKIYKYTSAATCASDTTGASGTLAGTGTSFATYYEFADAITMGGGTFYHKIRTEDAVGNYSMSSCSDGITEEYMYNVTASSSNTGTLGQLKVDWSYTTEHGYTPNLVSVYRYASSNCTGTVVSKTSINDGISVGSPASYTFTGGTEGNTYSYKVVVIYNLNDDNSGTSSCGVHIINNTDSVAPTVSGVSSTSSNGSYLAGSVIPITVTFSENVYVTGTPQLKLETGTTDQTIDYSSGSGTSVLTFNYIVQPGDTSSDLNYFSTTALTLNGGTIKDIALNSATLTLPALAGAGSLATNKNLVIDTTKPTVTNVTSSTANGTYIVGNSVSIQVTFSEVVNVTGTPQLTLETGTTDRAVNYSSGTGTNTLTFTYTVQAGDNSSDLNYTSTSALALNGGLIRDGATNTATLTLPALAGAGSLATNKNIVIDGVVPTVTNVTSSTANGTYTTGDSISIQVTFSELVNVTGTPQLTLETGTTDRTANYSSGTGTTTLTFTYTVQSGDTSSDLNYASTSALALNSGTIKDASTNNATLTLPALAGAGSLATNKNIVIDGAIPQVSSVSSSTANGFYEAANVIAITITFTEAVTVTGTPQLTLETGTTDQVVNYSSGSGTATLTFNYTVQAGDTSADLDYVGTSSLALNGGSIKDSSNNNAILTLATPGAAGSLGANKAIVIDTTTPVVSNVHVQTGSSHTSGDGYATTGSSNTIPAGTNPNTLYMDYDSITETYPNQTGFYIYYTNADYPTSATGSPAVASYWNATATATPTPLLTTFVTTNTVNNNGNNWRSDTGVQGVPNIGTAYATLVNGCTYIRYQLYHQDKAGVQGTNAAYYFIKPYTPPAPTVAAVNGSSTSVTVSVNKATNECPLIQSTATLELSYAIHCYDTTAGSNCANGEWVQADGSQGSSPVYQTPTTWGTQTVTGLIANHQYTFYTVSRNYYNASTISSNGSTASATTAPVVTNVTSSVSNGSYNAGDVIDVKVTFSAAVTVTGTPRITLETGSTDRTVNYSSGSGTTTLTFNYTVQSGDASTDLDYASTSALALNSGTIKNSSGTSALLTLPTVGAAGSLGANKDIIIDTDSPTVGYTSITPSSPGNTATPVVKGTVADTSVADASITVTLYSNAGCTTTISSGVAGDVFEGGAGITTNALTTNVSYSIYAKAVDPAGNASSCTLLTTYIYDSSAPTVTFVSITPTSPGNTDTPVVKGTVTDTGSTDENITVTLYTDSGCTSSASSGVAGDVFESGSGITTSALTANVAHTLYARAVDEVGNASSCTSLTNYTYDTAGPTVVISSAATDPTSSSPFTVTITFSESVTGFTIGDITVGNGSASNFSGSGTTYTVDITPSAEGVVTVDVAASVAQDSVGNDNAAATQLSRTYDGTRPTVVITSAESSPTMASSIPVTITFNESVTGFVIGDITVGNGSASNFSGSGTTYTVDITPGSEGTVTVDVAANKAQDAAGNQNTAATQFSIVYSNGAPVVTITSPAANSWINAATAASFAVGGGCESGLANDTVTVRLTDGSGTVLGTAADCTAGAWTANLNMSAVSDATSITVWAEQTDDLSNTTSSGNTRDFGKDTVLPTAVVSGPSTSVVKNGETVDFDITLADTGGSDLAAGYALAINEIQLIATGTADCTTINVSNPSTASPKVTLSDCTGDGTIRIKVKAGSIADTAGNENILSDQSDPEVVIDNTPPTAFAVTSPLGWTNVTKPSITWSDSTGATSYTIKLDDDSDCSSPIETSTQATTTYNVSADLSVGTTYTICVSATDGVFVTDAPTQSLQIEQDAPVIAVTSGPVPTLIKGGQDVVYQLTISDAGGSGFGSSPVNDPLTFDSTGTAECADAQIVQDTNDPTLFIFTFVNCTGDGTVGFTFASGALVDNAGNWSAQVVGTPFTVDSTAPGAFSITAPTANSTTNDLTPTITWAAATDATLYDVFIDDTSGCASPVDQSADQAGTTYTPSTDLASGDYYVCVVAKDSAGNTTSATNDNLKFTVQGDVTGPIITWVTSNKADGTYRAGELIDILVTFNENATVTGTPKLTLETGTTDAVLDYVSGSGTTTLLFNYTVADGEESADLDYLSNAAFDLNGGTIQDAAGNNADVTLPDPGVTGSLGDNKALVIDAKKPLVTISAGPTPAAVNLLGSASFTIHIEDVGPSGLDPSYSLAINEVELEKTGTADCTTINVQDANTPDPIVTLSDCSGDGTVKIKIKSGSIADVAGNENDESDLSTELTVDNTPPDAFAITAPSAWTNLLKPEITWDTANGASSYLMKISDTTGCPSSIEDINQAGASYTVLNDLTVATPYFVCVTASDDAGNMTNATELSFQIETTQPTVVIADPTLLTVNSAQITQFNLTLDDQGGSGLSTSNDLLIGQLTLTSTGTVSCNVQVDNGTTSTPSVVFSNCTGDGTMTIRVNQGAVADGAGNVNDESADATVFTVDNGVPDDFNILTPDTWSMTDLPTLTWEASSVDVVTYHVDLDDSSDCSSPLESSDETDLDYTVQNPLAENTSYYICVRAIDASGNFKDATNNALEFKVDKTAPTVALEDVSAEFASSSKPMEISVTLDDQGGSDLEAGYELASAEVVALNDSGTAACATVVVDDGTTLTPKITVSDCTGSGVVRVRVLADSIRDAAGNPNVVAEVTFQVDNTPPGALTLRDLPYYVTNATFSGYYNSTNVYSTSVTYPMTKIQKQQFLWAITPASRADYYVIQIDDGATPDWSTLVYDSEAENKNVNDDGTSANFSFNGTSLGANMADLADGVYSARVIGFDGAGNSVISNVIRFVVDTTAPDWPSNGFTSIVLKSGGIADLSWIADATDDGMSSVSASSNKIIYMLYKATIAADSNHDGDVSASEILAVDPNGTRINPGNVPTNPYSITGLTSGTKYVFVRAIDLLGNKQFAGVEDANLNVYAIGTEGTMSSLMLTDDLMRNIATSLATDRASVTVTMKEIMNASASDKYLIYLSRTTRNHVFGYCNPVTGKVIDEQHGNTVVANHSDGTFDSDVDAANVFWDDADIQCSPNGGLSGTNTPCVIPVSATSSDLVDNGNTVSYRIPEEYFRHSPATTYFVSVRPALFEDYYHNGDAGDICNYDVTRPDLNGSGQQELPVTTRDEKPTVTDGTSSSKTLPPTHVLQYDSSGKPVAATVSIDFCLVDPNGSVESMKIDTGVGQVQYRHDASGGWKSMDASTLSYVFDMGGDDHQTLKNRNGDLNPGQIALSFCEGNNTKLAHSVWELRPQDLDVTQAFNDLTTSNLQFRFRIMDHELDGTTARFYSATSGDYNRYITTPVLFPISSPTRSAGKVKSSSSKGGGDDGGKGPGCGSIMIVNGDDEPPPPPWGTLAAVFIPVFYTYFRNRKAIRRSRKLMNQLCSAEMEWDWEWAWELGDG